MTKKVRKEENTNKALGIGITGALIASLCCITPLVIVFFGLGSISFALSFTKYKLFFIILGSLFIGLAVFLKIKKPGATCSINPEEIRKKKYFIIVAVITMVILYFVIQNYILPILGKIVYS